MDSGDFRVICQISAYSRDQMSFSLQSFGNFPAQTAGCADNKSVNSVHLVLNFLILRANFSINCFIAFVSSSDGDQGASILSLCLNGPLAVSVKTRYSDLINMEW